MAIVKALEAIRTIKISNNTPRTIIIQNDRITLESLKNMKNRHQLIELGRLLHWKKKTGT
jgi:hypothetical protein